MKFWTILVITYGVSVFDAEQSAIAYPSEEACSKAIEPVFATLAESYPDLMIQCVPTTQLSATLRPKRNPRYE